MVGTVMNTLTSIADSVGWISSLSVALVNNIASIVNDEVYTGCFMEGLEEYIKR